jgi:serine/threonine protein kinase
MIFSTKWLACLCILSQKTLSKSFADVYETKPEDSIYVKKIDEIVGELDYEFESFLGSGGYGKVFEVSHKISERLALKIQFDGYNRIVFPSCHNNKIIQNNFKIDQYLVVPSIIREFTFKDENKAELFWTRLCFTWMELALGSLDQIFENLKKNNKKLSEVYGLTFEMIEDTIFKAFELLYQKELFHNDWKEENILLCKQEDKYLTKINDYDRLISFEDIGEFGYNSFLIQEMNMINNLLYRIAQSEAELSGSLFDKEMSMNKINKYMEKYIKITEKKGRLLII